MNTPQKSLKYFLKAHANKVAQANASRGLNRNC